MYCFYQYQKILRRNMAKKTLEELAEQTGRLSKEIECSFTQVIFKDEIVTQKAAVNIVQFVACIEEIFNRIHHRTKGRRVPQREIIQAIQRLGMNTKFITAFEKLKMLRNKIVHQINFNEPMYRYLSRDLYGLDHCKKMKVRMKIIVEVVQEEVYFQTI